MKPLTEQEIRKIVQDEMRKNYMSGNPDIAPHSHNGTDGLNVDPHDLIGFSSIPSTSTKYLNYFTGTYSYGFGSPIITKNAQAIVNNSNAIYPFPVIVGDIGGLDSFLGGSAPEGTIVLFYAFGGFYEIWCRLGGEWKGTELTLTKTDPVA